MRGEFAMQYLVALAVSKSLGVDAAAYAVGRFRDGVKIADAIEKAAVDATAATGTLPGPAAADFAEFIRPLTLLGRIARLRRIPASTRVIVAASGGATASWGQGLAVRVSKQTLAGQQFDTLRVAGLSVVTKEHARSELPGAESLIARDVTGAVVAAMDQAFADPENSGVSNEKPASITNAATSVASSGSTLSAIDSDLEAMINRLSDAGSNLESAAFIMPTKTALYLSRLRGSGGALAHPQMTWRGGVLLGLPAYATSGYPDASGSPSTRSIALLDADSVAVVDNNAGSFEVSDRASVLMTSDADSNMQSNATATGASLVSMFQTESLAIRASRFVNWTTLRDGCVQLLTNVSY